MIIGYRRQEVVLLDILLVWHCGSKLTIVSIAYLPIALCTISRLTDGYDNRFSYIELVLSGSCCSCEQITCLHNFSSMLWCRRRILPLNDVRFVFTPSCFVRGFMFYSCYWYLFTYFGVQYHFHTRWCSCRLTVTWHMSLVKQTLLILPKHPSWPPAFNGVTCCSIITFSTVFCRSLFVFLSFFLWPLYCLFFFNLRLMITPLISSNRYCTHHNLCVMNTKYILCNEQD